MANAELLSGSPLLLVAFVNVEVMCIDRCVLVLTTSYAFLFSGLPVLFATPRGCSSRVMLHWAATPTDGALCCASYSTSPSEDAYRALRLSARAR
jgi:hypothetical protein